MSNTTDILLCSEEKIKSYTNLNTNLAPEELVSYIYDAQNIYLPNYLGGTYYNALKERVYTGTLTDPDIYLLDNFVGQVLCNFAFYMATTFIQYRSYAKGLFKGTSENGEPLDLDELKFLQSQIKNIAEAYANQMVLFLMTHSNEYPLYNSPKLKDGQLPAKNNAYTVNITVPNMPYAVSQRAWRSLGYGAAGYGPYSYYQGVNCLDLPNTGN